MRHEVNCLMVIGSKEFTFDQLEDGSRFCVKADYEAFLSSDVSTHTFIQASVAIKVSRLHYVTTRGITLHSGFMPFNEGLLRVTFEESVQQPKQYDAVLGGRF